MGIWSTRKWMKVKMEVEGLARGCSAVRSCEFRIFLVALFTDTQQLKIEMFTFFAIMT